MAVFIDVEGLNGFQLAFLTAVYGYILYFSSGLISDGSELLLLIPSVAGIVGSIVLPILGAVPDGMMVLFSGLGPDAQNQVSVGVGALAGSTVMLLTIPWFIAVLSGGVPLVDGKANYGSKDKVPLFQRGVSFDKSIPKAAMIMIATTLMFLVIQIPAYTAESGTGFEKDGKSTETQATTENTWAGIGTIACIIAFGVYLALCYMDANEDKELNKIIECIQAKTITIAAAVSDITVSGGSEPLLDKEAKRLKCIIKPFFKVYDTNGDQKIDNFEFYKLLNDLGANVTPDEAKQMFQDADTDKNQTLSRREFTQCLTSYLAQPDVIKSAVAKNNATAPTIDRRPSTRSEGDDEDEDEPEMPEDIASMDKSQQLKMVAQRACIKMGIGTFLVLTFSDPMVDCLSQWGTMTGIPAFYISFVLAPFASNASELLAAYTYASKKSQKTITTSLSTLLGAACMNNTFCLAIFLGLVWAQNLAWQFTAETIGIIVIQWIIGIMAIVLKTHTTRTAFLVFACYPGCLVLIVILEKFGWD